MIKGASPPENRESQISLHHRFSLSSLLLRTSSTGSEPKGNVFGSSNPSKTSLRSSVSTTKLTSDPIIAEDFADSDGSSEINYSDDDAKTAESIYSVIQEYELSRSGFWFDEDFENSPESARSAEEHSEVAPQTLISPRIPFTIPEEGQGGEHAGNLSRQAVSPDSPYRAKQLRGPIRFPSSIRSPSSETLARSTENLFQIRDSSSQSRENISSQSRENILSQSRENLSHRSESIPNPDIVQQSREYLPQSIPQNVPQYKSKNVQPISHQTAPDITQQTAPNSTQHRTESFLQPTQEELPYPNISPLIDSHQMSTFAQTSSPQVLDSVEDPNETTSSRNSRGNASSLSSGELLSRLEVTSYRSSLSSKRDSSELVLHTLIAEVDLDTELPVMVYSVHDKNERQNRWSAYEKPSRVSLSQGSKHPPAIPIQIREGTSRARRVSVSSVSISAPSRPRSPGSVTSPENTPRARSLIQTNTANPPIPLRSLSARNSIVRSSNSSFGTESFMQSKDSPASRSTPKSGATGSPTATGPTGPAGAHFLTGSPVAQIATGLPRAQIATGSPMASGSPTATGAAGSSPGVFSNVGGAIAENEQGGSPRANVESTIFDRKSSTALQTRAHDSNAKSSEAVNAKQDAIPIQPFISSPAPSITRDSGEKQRHHETMFYDEKAAGDSYTQQPKSLNMPWSKWCGMMIAALVAVPIFFLLPFGVFDHGGFSHTSDRNMALDEKAVSANWRFQRRYTRVQKIASFFLGLVWILTVLAMIGVGFGVGLTRLRSG